MNKRKWTTDLSMDSVNKANDAYPTDMTHNLKQKYDSTLGLTSLDFVERGVPSVMNIKLRECWNILLE